MRKEQVCHVLACSFGYRKLKSARRGGFIFLPPLSIKAGVWLLLGARHARPYACMHVVGEAWRSARQEILGSATPLASQQRPTATRSDFAATYYVEFLGERSPRVSDSAQALRAKASEGRRRREKITFDLFDGAPV